MLKIPECFFAFLLITLTFGQSIDLSSIYASATKATLGPEYQNPGFLKVINNYFGCKTWKNGACLQCSASYIFNKNGICCLVDTNCQNFNRDMGVCELCYTGYSVDSNGTCAVTLNTNDKRVGCAQWSNNICKACSAKYYFGANNVCVPVSDDCRQWNTITGQCTRCYQGYVLNKGTCILDKIQLSVTLSTSDMNPLCKTWKDSVCQQCAQRAYFDSKRVCQLVNIQCQTWDLKDGLCLTCYKGYLVQNGTCSYSLANIAPVVDIGCKTWNSSICLECSLRWVFSKSGICIPVSDLCRSNDFNGNCFTCYPGYTLLNGTCQYVQQKLTDIGCAKWDWKTRICLTCSNKWAFNNNGICTPVNDTCRTFDNNRLCTGCYRGYEVVNGACQPAIYRPVQSLGCKVWNWQSNICSQCSPWWYLNTTTGKCLEVSNLCKNYTSSGQCTSCFKGYDLNGGLCTPSLLVSASDLGCKTFKDSFCIECSQNWVFNSKNVCISVSDQCKTFDELGNCLTCYPGYTVTNGTCTFVTEVVPDLGCKTWDWSKKLCLACSPKYVSNANGNCVPVSDQCRTFDQKTGACTSCFRGYDLVSNQSPLASCVISASKDTGPSDLGCKLWNWQKQLCIECSLGWVFSSGKCVPISSNCKSSDVATGQCITCYLGYDLSQGSCVNSSSLTAAPLDLGCKTFKNGVCTECSLNWVFNDKKVCVAVSDQCKSYSGLLCTSCFKGYVLVNGTCLISLRDTAIPTDAGCKNWDWNAQKCLECSEFWYFNKGICTPVSDLCKTYNNITGFCLSCFKGYALANGTCIVQDRSISDVGCARWDWDNNKCLNCSYYWVFNSKGVCTTVSPYCKTYDSLNGACTSCFLGYSLINGACTSVLANLCKSTNESGCVSCYDGFALYQKQCINLENLANIALYYAECCPEKLAQLKAEGRIPQ